MPRMDGQSIWWVVQGAVVAAAAVALVFALWLQRGYAQGVRAAADAARDSARLSLQAAELHARMIESAGAVVQAAARVQRLASRPVLKVARAVQGPLGDVGRTPVVFTLRLHNVGHGTAVIEQVQLLVRNEVMLTYGAGEPAAELAGRIGSDVFLKAVGASLKSLSGTLTVASLTEDARALEAAGVLDLLRVQVFAHNAEAVEQGFATLGARIDYRDLDGGQYSSAEQFRSL